jgi:hypothetical protein
MSLIEVILFIVPFFAFSAFAETIPDYNNPYAPIFTDKEIYTWTDKIRFTIAAPSWNANQYGIDSIGTQEGHFIKISTSENSLKPFKLTETDLSSGIFTGEVILTGFLHDANGDGKSDTSPRTFGNGPTSSFLEVERDDGITLSFEFADGVVLTHSALVRWNIADIKFDKSIYALGQSAIIEVLDPDMNLNPERIDQIDIQVSSISDVAGIIISAIETSEESGLFTGTVSFTQTRSSSGDKLFAIPGNSLLAKYKDYTLPSPYSILDNLEISTKSEFVSDIPPTERVFVEKNFLTNSFGELISNPSIDEQLQIVGNVINNQNYEQPFVFIIQIKDDNGTIVSLSWIKGELSANQDLEVSQSWNPTKVGNYTIESFVWNSLSESIPLSPTLMQTYLIE